MEKGLTDSNRNYTEHVCKNCNHPFTGNHCNNCGQKVAHRLDTRHIIHEAVHVFTHADKGIFSLIPMVLFRPGVLALQYVQGKRKRYFSIFQYLILIVGVVTFIMAKTNLDIPEAINSDSTIASESLQAAQHQVMGFLQQYLNLFLFAFIPVFSFFSWLFFRSKGYNYPENFVLQVAIQAQINTYFFILILPMAIVFGRNIQNVLLILSAILLFGCNTVANRQFFKVSVAQAFFKGLLVYICTNIIQIILVFLTVMIIVMQYK